MKIKTISFTVMTLVLLQLVYCQDGADSVYTFERFEKQFQKQYTAEERITRKAVFEKNYQRLLEARAKSQGNYQVRVNDLTDMTEEQLAKFFNYRPLQLDMPYDQLPGKNLIRSIALPQAFNYTALGKVTPVKNQRNCGSCWAFASTAMYESQLLIKGIGQYDLSQQYVLECTPQSSCEGGWPNTALHTFAETGIPTEQSLPYKPSTASEDTCKTQPLIKLPYEIESIKHYNEVPPQDLKQILLDNGPVSVGIKGNNNGFLFYGGGVFTGCEQTTTPTEIDHVLLLVGWTKDGDWIVKNSWGKGWGDRGYAIISGNRDCGLTRFVDVLKVSKKLITYEQEEGAAVVDQANQMENLKVKISDSFGDGWNGYVLGVRQDNSILTVFGEEFKSGSEQGPIDIEIKSGVQTSIVVAVAGKNSQQIGFSIVDSDGKEVCSRKPGTPFSQTIIFCTFCPNCQSPNTSPYFYTLFSKQKNGWNGNILSFTQNGEPISIGEQFVSGQKYGPRKISLLRNSQVTIAPYMLGTDTQNIGIQVRDSFGNLIFQRKPGQQFLANATLGKFCVQCQNYFYVNYNDNGDQDRSSYEVVRFVNEKAVGLIVAVSVLGVMVVILGGIAVFLSIRLTRKNGESLIQKSSSLTSTQQIQSDNPPQQAKPNPPSHPLPSAESFILGTIENIDDSNPAPERNRFSDPNISSKANIISTKNIK